MATNTNEESEELWHDCPLFAPDASFVPNLAEGDSADHLPEAVGALSHLLFDDDTPEEIAEDLREQGNTLFKHGSRPSYIRAVTKYSEALNVHCDNAEVKSAAYANRAAAHLKLKNYGKALADAEEALKLNGDHVKSRYRAAVCCVQLRNFKLALKHCDEGLSSLQRVGMGKSADLALFSRLQKAARFEHDNAVAEETARRKRMERAESKTNAISQSLAKRGVTMGLPIFAQQRGYSQISAVLEESADGDARKEPSVAWPLLVVYPDVVGTGVGDQSDYMERVSEDATIDDVIVSLFPNGAPPPPWDVSGAYSRRADKLVAQYRTDWTMRKDDADSDDERDFVGSNLGPNDVGPWKSIPRSTSIAKLVRRPDYIVPLFPVFYVVPA